jgi:hypothetical protein
MNPEINVNPLLGVQMLERAKFVAIVLHGVAGNRCELAEMLGFDLRALRHEKGRFEGGHDGLSY